MLSLRCLFLRLLVLIHQDVSRCISAFHVAPQPKALLLSRMTPVLSGAYDYHQDAFSNHPYQSSFSMLSDDHGQQDHHPVTKLKRAVDSLRATMRAATGLSVTAMYFSFVTFTSFWVRKSMTLILSILPTWLRYFLQPFLILYYVPLYMLRTWASPKKRQERRDLYLEVMEDVKRGMVAADTALESWPVTWNSESAVIATQPVDLDEGLNQ